MKDFAQGTAAERIAPLEGVTVLDFSRVLSGPFCTMLLADMGARVIKIEHPERGDDTRHWGPPFVGGESAYFLSVNRNKESVALDFKQPAGRRVIDALLPRADVLVENFRVGAMARAGLGYETIGARYPRLIYCSISGYGQTGLLEALGKSLIGREKDIGGQPLAELGIELARGAEAELHPRAGVLCLKALGDVGERVLQVGRGHHPRGVCLGKRQAQEKSPQHYPALFHRRLLCLRAGRVVTHPAPEAGLAQPVRASCF